MKNGALNSTIPRALRGALSRSTTTVFNGCDGLTSMYAVPSTRSYAPTLPNRMPPANDRRCSTTNATTRPSLGRGNATAQIDPMTNDTNGLSLARDFIACSYRMLLWMALPHD